MRKILFLTTSPTSGGNGDTLITAAMEEPLAHSKKIGRCATED